MSGPNYSQVLSQRQTQSLVLAPQLRQSLKILQVAALDLRSVIQEELQNNPTLEELPMDGNSLQTAPEEKEQTRGDGDGTESGQAPADADAKREEMDFTRQFEILGKMDDDWRDYTPSAPSYTAEDAERRQHLFDSLVSETSLQEHLMRQAELAEMSPDALKAMEHLVGSLDDRGFLTQSPADVALQTGLSLEAVVEKLGI